eukprot:Opistho-2@35014
MDMNKMDGMNMKGDSNSNKMNMNKMDGMDMGQMDMPSEFNYDMLRSITPTTLDSNLIPREVKLKLTGNMLRYIWSFDDKTLSNSDKILIRKGEKVRFVLQNTTMMRHPM